MDLKRKIIAIDDSEDSSQDDSNSRDDVIITDSSFKKENIEDNLYVIDSDSTNEPDNVNYEVIESPILLNSNPGLPLSIEKSGLVRLSELVGDEDIIEMVSYE